VGGHGNKGGDRQRLPASPRCTRLLIVNQKQAIPILPGHWEANEDGIEYAHPAMQQGEGHEAKPAAKPVEAQRLHPCVHWARIEGGAQFARSTLGPFEYIFFAQALRHKLA
jgi:hypothetical protein